MRWCHHKLWKECSCIKLEWWMRIGLHFYKCKPMLVPNCSLKNMSIETCFVGRQLLSAPFVCVRNTALFCCGYFIQFKFLNFGRNWSVNHLLWWSPSKAGRLGFDFGENHPFWPTTNCCGWEALKRREGEKRGKAEYGNGKCLLHCSHFLRL